jgi:hypothetical protein
MNQSESQLPQIVTFITWWNLIIMYQLLLFALTSLRPLLPIILMNSSVTFKNIVDDVTEKLIN